MRDQPSVNLASYDMTRHDPGAGVAKRWLWYAVNALVFDSWWCPAYGVKRGLLRGFGARVDAGVIIKPRVNIKYPWRLAIGARAWIGEGVWLDNVGGIDIGADACLSQGAYVCTGNHDWSDPRFALRVAPVAIAAQVWIGARAVIAPGVSLGEGSVALAGSVVTSDTAPWTIYAGNPAQAVRPRALRPAGAF